MPGQLTVYTVTNLKILTEFLMQQRNPPATRKSCFFSSALFCINLHLCPSGGFRSKLGGILFTPSCRVMLIDDGLEKVVQSNTYLHCNPEGQNVRQNLSGWLCDHQLQDTHPSP